MFDKSVYSTLFLYFIARGVTDHIDGLVQERRKPSALAMELGLSCTNPSIYITEIDLLLLFLYKNACQILIGFFNIFDDENED